MFINQNKNLKHAYYMGLALQQAKKTIGNTRQNPAVGCIITKFEKVIGAGYTSINGRPHAEFNALNSSNSNLKNSYLYVTLEPCSHYGKTPPCVKFIIKKKIKKVFFSINDPDQRSFNKSKKILRKNSVSVTNGVLKDKIKSFYTSYIRFKEKKIPFVTCKLAISKDFFTINKKKDWITNEFSRSRVQLMRSEHDCILTSSTTIAEDNPRLYTLLFNLLKLFIEYIIQSTTSFMCIKFLLKFGSNIVNFLSLTALKTKLLTKRSVLIL